VTRLNKSIKNARVAFIFYFIALVLAFISRKVFIDSLGTELVGLSATMRNILGFLNLAELGIYTAVATSLYKPLFDKDQNKVNEIISLFGFLYRIIGFVILGIGIIVSLFLPNIFAKTQLDFLILYAAFYTFLAITLVSYFNNYKQVLLVANQQTYVTTRLTNWVNILKVAIQIVYLKYLNGNYFGWLGIELVFGLALRFWINHTISKKYPWLNPNLSQGRVLMARNREVLLKVKQLFAHKIAGFVSQQSSNILIYALTSLTVVTYYTNYLLIFQKISLLISSTLGSNLAGIGHVVAENNKGTIHKVFWEFNALFFWIAGIFVFSFYYLTEPFISLWLGEEFILSHLVLIIMLINAYIFIIRNTAVYFLNAYALFKDVWAPWAEATLNLIISIAVGYYYGLIGVILGIAISTFLIESIWKPFFLFRNGFKEKFGSYLKHILKYPALLILSWLIMYPLVHSGWLPNPLSYLNCLVFALCISVPFSIIYGFLLFFGAPGMKDLYNRMIPVVAGRLHKFRK